jgi:hypothetical protein
MWFEARRRSSGALLAINPVQAPSHHAPTGFPENITTVIDVAEAVTDDITGRSRRRAVAEAEYVPVCEAERRLRLEYINIAQHGVKEHLGRRLTDDVVLVLFDRRRGDGSIAALWSLRQCSAITSQDLPFGLGMLWDWDWRAKAVEQAFDRLSEGFVKPSHDQSVSAPGACGARV